MTADRASLPWSAEAEQAVLGSLLLSPDAFGRVVGKPLGSAFYNPAHRTIWIAIAELEAQRKPVDVISVFDCLAAAGSADTCGGMGYLHELINGVVNPGHIAHYADLVLDRALKRRIIEAAGQAVEMARGPGEAIDLLGKVGGLFAELAPASASGGARSIAELALDRADRWNRLRSGERDAGFATGFGKLDDALGGGLKPGRVIVLAARPSVGKTSLAMALGIGAAQHGARVLVLSLEMPAGELVDRAIANLGRADLGEVSSGKDSHGETAGRIVDGAEAASKLQVFVDDTPGLSLAAIRAKVQQHQHRHGLDVLVVDYLQLCSAGPTGRNEVSRHHQIEAISRGLKVLAKEAGICVLLLSQLNREADGREPDLAHLKESGAIEEDADVVALLHPTEKRDDHGMVVLAKLAKNRQGRRGRFALSFDGRTQRWAESHYVFASGHGGAS